MPGLGIAGTQGDPKGVFAPLWDRQACPGEGSTPAPPPKRLLVQREEPGCLTGYV